MYIHRCAHLLYYAQYAVLGGSLNRPLNELGEHADIGQTFQLLEAECMFVIIR